MGLCFANSTENHHEVSGMSPFDIQRSASSASSFASNPLLRVAASSLSTCAVLSDIHRIPSHCLGSLGAIRDGLGVSMV